MILQKLLKVSLTSENSDEVYAMTWHSFVGRDLGTPRKLVPKVPAGVGKA